MKAHLAQFTVNSFEPFVLEKRPFTVALSGSHKDWCIIVLSDFRRNGHPKNTLVLASIEKI